MEDKSHREPMLKDLCKNYLVIGMNRNDIIKLLGQPESIKDSIQSIPKGVLWDKKMFNSKTEEKILKKDSLLYLFYSKTCSRMFINIDSYVCGFNGSGPDYLFIIYDKNNRLVDYKLGKTEF
jgi:hypothetical protein